MYMSRLILVYMGRRVCITGASRRCRLVTGRLNLRTGDHGNPRKMRRGDLRWRSELRNEWAPRSALPRRGRPQELARVGFLKMAARACLHPLLLNPTHVFYCTRLTTQKSLARLLFVT